MGWGDERDGLRRVVDGIVQVSDSNPGWWRDDSVQVARVDAVQAQQDVEVHSSACLEFGGLAVGHPDRRHPAGVPVRAGDQHEGQAAAAGQVGELALDVLLGAPPQFPGGMVPDGMGVVVVAVRAQRLADSRVAAFMAGEAEQGLAVLAGAPVVAGVAGIGAAGAPGPVGAGVAADRPGVDWAEQHSRKIEFLRQKADGGASIRILLGDPDCPQVALRGQEEDIGNAIAAKIRNVLLAYYRPYASHPGINIRLHATTLYNSIYWFDDDMLVNTHAYGVPAHFAPVIHLRHLSSGTLFQTYARSFDRVWDQTWKTFTGKEKL